MTTQHTIDQPGPAEMDSDEARAAHAAHLLDTRRSCAHAWPDLAPDELEARAVRHAWLRVRREREQRRDELDTGIRRTAWALSVALKELSTVGFAPFAEFQAGMYLARAQERIDSFNCCREEYQRAQELVEAAMVFARRRIGEAHQQRITPEPRAPKKRGKKAP